MAHVLKSAVIQRVKGDKPSVAHATVAALIAGVACAVLTYRVMRS